MTPQEKEQFNTMLRQVEELYQWMQQRKTQQIAHPLDDASKNTIGGVIYVAPGSATKTQSVAVSGDPQNISVPAAYTGTIVIIAAGGSYEIPYL